MGDFNTVLDYCKLFLSNSITFNESGEFDNFAFLLKTEVLFEDFISNLSAKYFKNIHAQVQEPLDDEENFYIRPDLIVGSKNKPTKIIDIKYKDVKGYSNVSQADIYQCVTYAMKKGCDNVTLLYPSFDNSNKNLENVVIINTDKNTKITVSFKFIECCPPENMKSIKEYEKSVKDNIISNHVLN
jgi:5-methylcytosine-specific restriction enzyme subunit McrC